MQKWEYAYIARSWQQDNKYTTLVYLGASDATKNKSLRGKGGIFKDAPNFWGACMEWIYQLGQEGYEMISVKGDGFMPHQSETYWFKRPVSDD